MRALILFVAVLFASISTFGQHFTGCVVDTVAAKRLPEKASNTRDVYSNLPKAVSLQKWTPVPGNQGQTGTCTAWSSTYCIATMSWAMRNGITNRKKITENAYLPAYTYVNILRQSTQNCAAGTDIADACAWLKNTGSVKLSEYPQNPACINTSDVPTAWKQKAAQNRILGFTKLYYQWAGGYSYKVEKVKKSLAEGKPVLIAFNCAFSFSNGTGIRSDGLWVPASNEQATLNYGGHAMAVVAYDDTKFNGGAFLVQNSWGTDWGLNGYFWITYYHFAWWVYYAFEINTQINNAKIDTNTDNLDFSTNFYDYADNNDYNNNDYNYYDDNNNNNNYDYNDGNDSNNVDYTFDDLGLDDFLSVDYDYLDNFVDGDDYRIDNDDNNDSDNDDNSNYTSYNILYQDGDNGAWKGYKDSDYTAEDYNYMEEERKSRNSSAFQYVSNMSYEENMKHMNESLGIKDAPKNNAKDRGVKVISVDKIKTPDGNKVDVNNFAGSISIILGDNTAMQGTIRDKTINISKSYQSGTYFRIYVENNSPAYVYVFGTDLTNEVYNIFPQCRLISPLLDYSDSRIAVPDERHFIQMDDQTGTDYIYVLYSRVPLNIDEIQKRMAKTSGDYAERLFKVMGPKTFSLDEANASGTSTFKFDAKSIKKQCLGAVIKINHTK